MKLIVKTKVSLKHKLGNSITGVTKIIDGLVSLITLGNYYSNLCLKWLIYRKNNNFLLDNK